MRVTGIQLKNYRSFKDSGHIDLGQVNVFIGANNTGKSTILRALHLIQKDSPGPASDIRSGEGTATINIEFENVNAFQGYTSTDPNARSSTVIEIRAGFAHDNDQIITMNIGNQIINFSKIPNTEQFHYIVPFFSRRKPAAYQENVHEQLALTISTDMGNMAARLSRIANPQFPAYRAYATTCEAIFGFVVTAVSSSSGLRPGIYLPNREKIYIDQMGDGVPHIVQMLLNLALSENKLFLIEEPENDLHPNALKALLDLIIESSKTNQFVISTHSNIVVYHLCSLANSKLFRVSLEDDELPTRAKINEIEPTPGARREALLELGYALSDIGLWDGWLILEEASAETIIENYLIPMFLPGLKRVRTISARGADNVEPHFKDFIRLMIFTHRQPMYHNRVWVRVDGDDKGNKIIETLRAHFRTYNEFSFQTFSEAQFERYYPAIFQEEVDFVLNIKDNNTRFEEKKKLLKEVEKWIQDNPKEAKEALAISAAPVINELRKIESIILANDSQV